MVAGLRYGWRRALHRRRFVVTRARELAFWVLVAFALFASFDHMMRVDAANLCSHDDTAYAECGQ